MNLKSVLALMIFMGMTTVTSASQITLDSGHSRRSPGAISCSSKHEYLYNQELANTVSVSLKKAGIGVKLTTEHSHEPSLAERAALARDSDLLISLHHDSVQPQFITRTRQGGACSNKASGFSVFVSARNPDYLKSLEYAKRLARSLKAKGLTPTLHHAEPISGENRKLLFPELGIYQYDELRILKTIKTPAILLEAAVIVNPIDEQRAASQSFRNVIADAILETIKQGTAPCKESCQLPSPHSPVHISPLLPALTSPRQ